MPILTKANPPEIKLQYEIRDPHCREISGQKLSVGQTTIWLKASEAQFFVANGGLSLVTTTVP